MATNPQRIADGSTLVGLVRAAVIQLRAWFAASWLASTGARGVNALATATDAAALTRGARTLAHWIHDSFLYRWLTKEPEPDVVVIDLRETYTVGPVVALLDRLVPTFGRAWRESHANHASEVLQKTATGAWITDSRTVQLLAAALEPPEPPEEERQE